MPFHRRRPARQRTRNPLRRPDVRPGRRRIRLGRPNRPRRDRRSHIRRSRLPDLLKLPDGEPRLVQMIVTDRPGRPEQITRRTIMRHPGEMLQLMPVGAGRKIRKPMQLGDPTLGAISAHIDVVAVLQVTAIPAEPNHRLRARIEHHRHRLRPTPRPQPLRNRDPLLTDQLVGPHHPLLNRTQRAQNRIPTHVRVGLQPKTEHHVPRLTMLHPMVDVDPNPRVLPRRLHPERTLTPRRRHELQRRPTPPREPIRLHPRHLAPRRQTLRTAIRHTPTTINPHHRRLHTSRPPRRRPGLHAHTSRERTLPRTPLERRRPPRQPTPGTPTLRGWPRCGALPALGEHLLPFLKLLDQRIGLGVRLARVDKPVGMRGHLDHRRIGAQVGLLGCVVQRLQRRLDHHEDIAGVIRPDQPHSYPQSDRRPRRQIHLQPIDCRARTADPNSDGFGHSGVCPQGVIERNFLGERPPIRQLPEGVFALQLDVVRGGGGIGQPSVQGLPLVPLVRNFHDREGLTINVIPDFENHIFHVIGDIGPSDIDSLGGPGFVTLPEV
ncbi:hypothetical protein B0E53_06897 [Micromonospora sp. MH33]|nr:hypothetical protein B0E53_06897 [Micromonospora sp. MH33]